MSAITEFSHKFGSQPRELKIGRSFFDDDANTVFHTVRYDFVPASIDTNKTSAIDFSENGKVTITMPNAEGSGTTESVYQGQRKPHQRECVLIINNETGDIILERLNQSMIVKKARLRQEDLTGKSLALNKNQLLSSSSNYPVPNGNVSLTNNIIPSASNAKNNANESSKKGQMISRNVPNLSRKPSPLLNGGPGTMPNNSTASSSVQRLNGMTNKTISPPSMPIFNTGKLANAENNSSKLQSTNNSVVENSSNDWKIKLPDPPPDSIKSNRTNTNQPPMSNCLSELSSSDSSDSDEENSSDHFSDIQNKNKVNNKNISKNAAKSTPPPSMPTLTTSVNDQKKNSAAPLSLSEDSDSLSSSDDEDESSINSQIKPNKSSLSETHNYNNNNNNNNNHNNNKFYTQTLSKFKDDTTESSNFQSMPKFSQLSQDLQLSESDSDD